MKKNWIKYVLWVIASPFILFILLAVLLCIPSVQNFVCDKAANYASTKSGMQISIGRIGIKLPLNLTLDEALVISKRDTILKAGNLDLSMKLFPLMDGRLVVDHVQLKNTSLYTQNIIKGICLKGHVGDAKVKTNVDFGKHAAIVDLAELKNSNMDVLLTPDTTKKDTTPSAPWQVLVKKIKISKVGFSYKGLPKDSMYVSAFLGDADASDIRLSTKEPWYSVGSLNIADGKAQYDSGKPVRNTHEFNPSHLLLRDIQLGVESFYMYNKVMKVDIKKCSFYDQSGFTIAGLQANLRTDNKMIYIPSFFVQTPYSEIRMNGVCPWNIMDPKGKSGNLEANVDAYIGKGDVLFWGHSIPSRLIHKYPAAPLVVHAGMRGNMKSMYFSRLEARLAGAFNMNGSGSFVSLTDNKLRSAKINLKLQADKLDFLTEMAGLTDGNVIIPRGLNLALNGTMNGDNYSGKAILLDGSGRLAAEGSFNMKKKSYKAHIKALNFQVNHFLPKYQVYGLTADAQAEGAGFDIKSNRTYAKVKASVGYLGYQKYKLSKINFDANLKNGLASAKFNSDNELLKMFADGSYTINLRNPRGKVDMKVDNVNLYKLGMISAPLKNNFAFAFNGGIEKDSVAGHLTAGDFKMDFNSREGLTPLMSHLTRVTKLLMHQIKIRKIDHAALRRALPTATVYCKSGMNNPIMDYLALEGIKYKDLDAVIKMSPAEGLNCDARLYGLKKDSTQIDTISLIAVQDTSHIEIHGKVVNGKTNPTATFTVALNGEINSSDGNITAEYLDKTGDTGLRLGMHFAPDEKRGGILLNLIPENPIIAFRKFHFQNDNNEVALLPNGRVFANIDLVDEKGMGFKVHSNDNDSTSLQNIEISATQVNLDEVARLLPYSPPFSGMLSLDANYIQSTKKTMSLSVEGNIDNLSYAHKEIGNITLGATWLPGEHGKQYVDGYVAHEGNKVLLADGTLNPSGGGKDTLSVNASFDHFPLKLANVFVPNQMVSFEGDIDGDMHLKGSTSKPIINGTMKMDSVVMTYNQAGTHFRFDDRPLQIVNNRIQFDKYAIYTTGDTPFTIDGDVNFQDLNRPTANLSMQAQNYALVNAPRSYGCLLYGKLIVDFNSTLKGPLNNLVMRGKMNVKDKTDITYVLDNTPLSVSDRLGDLVTFTNFSDTTNVYDPTKSNVSLGGLDLQMDLHIDPSVQLKADLSADRTSQVALEGGGDLYFHYSPQGEMQLVGRYSLTGTTIKYSMPMIPLKNFAVGQGSYIDWNGDPYNPRINFAATENISASVTQDDGSSQSVNFEVGLSVKDKLTKPTLLFTLAAPENANVQNQLDIMTNEERNKQAIVLLTTGIYLETGSKTNKVNMGTAALNSVLSNQINQLVGNIKNGSLSMGVENRNDETGGTVTDYSFRYSQRLFSNRVRIVIGGKISTGKSAASKSESFIDNISLEYRLDDQGSRYVQLFHNKNYASILDGEITETGVGVLLHKRVDHFGEIFIFRKRKKGE